MATVEQPPIEPTSPFDDQGFPWLENGERMDQKTFHERYSKMPPGTKAELIGGIVYIMASPVSSKHGRGDARISGWLFHYSVSTPGTEVQLASSTILGTESEPQPDSALLILPEWGGQTRTDEGREGFTIGAPELAVEVSLSSRSYDLREKLEDYERGGVREYLILDLRDSIVHWFCAVDGRFVPIAAGNDGLIRSKTFPGLWLDPVALLANDKRRMIKGLDRGLASPEHEAFVTDLERRRAELVGHLPCP
jgi:Uma2 family endonuclease